MTLHAHISDDDAFPEPSAGKPPALPALTTFHLGDPPAACTLEAIAFLTTSTVNGRPRQSTRGTPAPPPGAERPDLSAAPTLDRSPHVR